ncbi:MAG: hypothetical protein N3G75_08720 [Methanothrix sp.]|nr:hypothetical protein [Methanothrix sp.]MCX8207891.1 hypothetical protein [Methanothrix sp.]
MTVSYGPRLRDLIIEVIPNDRSRAVLFSEISARLPDHDPASIFRVLTKLVQWGVVRRETRVVIDRKGRCQTQFVFWRDA